MAEVTTSERRVLCTSALVALVLALPAVAPAQDDGINEGATEGEPALPNDQSSEATDGAAGYGLTQANAARADGRGYGQGRAAAGGGNSGSGGGAGAR